MKLTKAKLKQIIREELSDNIEFDYEDEDFSIEDLDDIPQQLERVLDVMGEGDYDAAFRRVRAIKGVVKSIIDSYKR